MSYTDAGHRGLQSFPHHIKQSFSIPLDAVDILVQTTLCCGVLCGIPGFSPLDASTPPPPAVTNKNISRHFQKSPEGQNWPQLRTTAIKQDT